MSDKPEEKVNGGVFKIPEGTDLFAAAKSALQSGVKEKIAKLLQEGRRAMIGEDFQASLQPLSECCHLITTNFGEMDPQLADPAYYYGSSLLEVVRATQNVFGGGVEEKVEGAKEEENKVGKEQLDSIPEEKEKSKSEVAGSSADRQDEDEEDEEEDDGDDAQIAYEWLEIARLLYSKNDDKTSKLREAESLSMLAELKTENDQLEDARSDYKAALEIFKAQLGKDDRKVATIYYQLGAVELFLQMPDESEKSFEAALEIIKVNISVKKNQIANDSDGKLVGKLLPEVEALQSLVPELEEKLAEAKQSVNEMKKIKDALKNAFGLGGASSGFEKPATEPTKINTLQVKRKSKPSSSQPEPKKQKP